MIKKVLDSRLPLIVYSPIKVFESSYFNSIYKAGALAVFDSEFFKLDETKKHLEELEKSKILFGVRLSSSNERLWDWLKEKAFNFLDTVILYDSYEKEINYPDLKKRDFKVIYEAKDINIKDTLDKISPDALILKGYEGGGRVSEYTSYILMQWYLHNTDYPVFIHGGVGMHNAAGIFAAGASGLVLDSQLYLAKEAPVSENFRILLKNMEELDTALIEGPFKTKFRFFAKLGTKPVQKLREREVYFSLEKNQDQDEYLEKADEFFKIIREESISLKDENADSVQSLFYLGQDSVFAKKFAADQEKLSDITDNFFKTIREHIADIEEHDPVRADTEIAREHGTRYPLIQGPMANISENSEFAKAVYREGALPFFAMGNLPEEIADEMLKNADKAEIPYGTGLIGMEAFNSRLPDHLKLIKKYKTPFAILAGATAFQAANLEKEGVKSYLHTPSAMMLENAIQNGCRGYILEGTEAGGHIGSLSSLVLWEIALDRISRMPEEEAKKCSLIFAGGISSPAASLLISGISAFLAKKGVKIAIQIGSAYLFTEEVRKAGLISQRYQKAILAEDQTLVIGRSVGLPSRTIASPFSLKILEKEHKRIAEGLALSERKRAFEEDNIGSLMIGAKGFTPDFKNKPLEYLYYDEDKIYEKGNFCIGDSLAFFNEVTSIREVHQAYFNNKEMLAKNLNQLEILSRADHEIRDEIAVVGLGCVLPDALSPEELWQNILDKKVSIGKLPDSRLNSSLYYSPERDREDKSYTQIGGFVENFNFDEKTFNYSREEAEKLSRSQQFILSAAKQAVDSACKDGGRLPENSAVIIGSCLANELTSSLQLKYYTPEIISEIKEIPEFQKLDKDQKDKFLLSLKQGLAGDNKKEAPDSAVLNIEASRISAHFNLKGANYVVDAACASSFAALECAIRELLSASCDAVITGGLNTNLTPETYTGFCRMGALSSEGSWPFDSRASGFVPGEGAVCFVLKRMKDALREKNTIYGVIKSIGSSSDGKGKAIAAPNPKGQILALERSFENAKSSVKAEDIDYIEAHGTSTIMGDAAEIETIKEVYTQSSAGISSVKSQIGHLLGGAGGAGLLKALLALKNKTLPPNGDFQELSKTHNIEDTELYIIEDAENWEVKEGKKRRAAVSSYGFGGINYHCLLEEYDKDYQILKREVFPDTGWDPNDDRIVICGIGSLVPGAENSEEFWQKLMEGKSLLSDKAELGYDVESYANEEDKSYYLPRVKAGLVKDFNFDNIKYRIPPSSASSIDRSQLFALTAADEAIRSSGLDKLLQYGNKISVILGTISGTNYVRNVLKVRLPFIARLIEDIEAIPHDTGKILSLKLIEKLSAKLPRLNEDTTPGLLSNIVSGRIANFFGCNGANFIIDAACASSAIAIRTGILNLLSQKSDFVISGGVDTNFYPTAMLVFKRLGLLSEDDTRIFDREGRGINLSEGAAIQVLCRYKTAKEHKMPVLAEIKGLEISSKAGNNMFAPSSLVFKEIIEKTYEKAGKRKEEVDHLDLFGFGHYLLDKIEHKAIKNSFDKDTACGNIKPEFGYFKAANPALVLNRMVLMNKYKTILPFHSFNADSSIISKEVKIIKDPLKTDKKELLLAANIFGFGGNHGHMLTGNLLDRNQESKKESIEKENRLTYHEDREEKTALLLSGQGSQYPGMLKELYTEDMEIRSIMDMGEKIFKADRGYSLLKIIFEDKKGRLNLTENTQPAVFLASAAIYEKFKKSDLKVSAILGHSIGEYTALFISGMLDFESAFKVILKRSSLMKEAAEEEKSGIMAVFKVYQEVEELIKESKIDDIYIANKNSRKQSVVAGSEKGISAFADFLSKKAVFYKKLKLSGAFHTPYFKDAAEKLSDYLKDINLNMENHSKLISNFTGLPYPDKPEEVKDLLVKQIYSPVNFMPSLEHLYKLGLRRFIEIGPSRILVNLVRDMDFKGISCSSFIEDYKKEDLKKKTEEQFKEEAEKWLKEEPEKQFEEEAYPYKESSLLADFTDSSEEDFKNFIRKNEKEIQKKLYLDYLKEKKVQELERYKDFNFYTGSVSIAGVSIGLPGTARHVFEKDNFKQLLSGQNFIEALSDKEKERLLDKNITKLVKKNRGQARFTEITNPEEVIQLAGKLGFFNLEEEYGIEEKYDTAIALAIAAGFEALKDAKIPLVMNYKKSSSENPIPDGFALPLEMQDSTGVIFTSLFTGWETLIGELEEYHYQKFFIKPYKEMEKIYYFLMGKNLEAEVKERLTEWFFKIWNKKSEEKENYSFKRNFPQNITPLGSAHFARFIKAKGPNIQMSGACASTTQAICLAEDWIRSNRCERVVIIGGEDATSKKQNPWIGSSFLSLGAASTKNNLFEAVKPFDEDRNGTILGAGATSLIVERTDSIERRGLKGQAKILGSKLGNSAFHTTGIDTGHLASEMKDFIEKTEKRHKLEKADYIPKTIFMSHETFTPARGGSSESEIRALRASFGDLADKISITNTKGYTGHTLGAAIEDAVMVKALQTGKLPPIANLNKIPENFKNLKFSKGEEGDFQYGVHLSAGFGSHFAFLFIEKTEEREIKANREYQAWLKKISACENPVLEEKRKLLVLRKGEEIESIKNLDESRREDKKTEKPEKDKGSDTAEIISKVKKIIAEQTGYTEDMLKEELDLEADLGIDTVKQIEILGRISSSFKLEIPEDIRVQEINSIRAIADFIKGITGRKNEDKPKEDKGSDTAEIISKVKKIIAEQTGYTEDMLKEELDLEADLGIDTVKQIEILGRISSSFKLEIPEDIRVQEINSIRAIADFIEGITGRKNEDKPKEDKGSDTAEIIGKVKKIIAEQTGYTEDMLKEELDLEADLGIDTVKQIEILGRISSSFKLEIPEDIRVQEINSIRAIADFIKGIAGRKKEDKAEKDKTPSLKEEKNTGIYRFIPLVREDKSPLNPQLDLKGKKVLISLDNIGLYREVSRILKDKGASLVSIGKEAEADIKLDFKETETVEAKLEELLEKHKDISIFIHLYPAGDNRDDKDDLQVLSFFKIIKTLYTKLEKAPLLIAIPAFASIVFPYTENKLPVDPVSAALAGLLKTGAKEFPETGFKVVDFNEDKLKADIRKTAEIFVREILSDNRKIETGYDKGRRYLLSLKEEKALKDKDILKECKAVFISGGALGISFEIVKELCRELEDTGFILTGRSDFSQLDEELEKADEKKLFEIMKEKMGAVKPVEIRNAVERIKKIRRAKENIEELKSLNKNISYYSADITDLDRIKSIAAKHPEVEGIIHTAGVEESQFILKKSDASFNRVFNTKVKGFKNLLKAFEGHKLKLILGFSSVTARFGNAAQGDYTAANDMLCKMLLNEKIRNSELIAKAISWTAWEDTGMATNESVKKVLEERGLTFLPKREGIRLFKEEINNSLSGEIVFSGLDRNFDTEGMLDNAFDNKQINWFLDSLIEEDSKKLSFKRTLDLKRDLFLYDHAMDQTPIFLAATGIESMAEAAAHLFNTDIKELSLENLEIPYGIKLLRQKAKEIKISAEKTGEGVASCKISSKIRSPEGEIEKLHYRGELSFADRKKTDELIQIPAFSEVYTEGELAELIYHPSRLFMDGIFRSIEKVLGFDGKRLLCLVNDKSKKAFFADRARPDFITPLVLLDAMFQTGGLFNMMSTEDLVLPYKIRKMQILEETEAYKDYLCLSEKIESKEDRDTFNMSLMDKEGRVFIKIEDFEMVKIGRLSKKLSIADKFRSMEKKVS